jgi:hypothetical protein
VHNATNADKRDNTFKLFMILDELNIPDHHQKATLIPEMPVLVDPEGQALPILSGNPLQTLS